MKIKSINITLIACTLCIGLIITLLCSSAHTDSQTNNAPQVIPEDLSCGKCGMFPAKYPQWQSQIVFADGKIAAFDGCKCMFGYIFNMEKLDPQHTRESMAAIWVRDFKSGEWVNARNARYVIGSDTMGPMGKELIPFANNIDAESFHQEHGGELASFDAISMATLKPLMGKMHMKNKMNMEGHQAK